MVGLILLALIAAVIIYISVAKHKKRAIVISLIILGSYHLYVSHTCGPNKEDVKVMKPMAEAISSYIIKHGVPEKLEDIPGLPYKLEDCEIDNELDRYTCKFVNRNRVYEVSYNWNQGGKLKFINLALYQYQSKTGVEYDLEYNDKLQKWMMAPEIEGGKYRNIRIYDNKTSGICNPMKQ